MSGQLIVVSAMHWFVAAAASAELESFGTLAHRLGAAAVLASLWQVADLRTAALMTRFYGQRREAERDEALALARAQRSFLAPAAPES